MVFNTPCTKSASVCTHAQRRSLAVGTTWWSYFVALLARIPKAAPHCFAKAQRRTQLSAAEQDSKLNQLYTCLYLQPSAIWVWVNLDEILLAGPLGNVQTLKHKGSSNVMVHSKKIIFKRMGTLIAMLAVIKEDGDFSALPLDPTLILKCKKPKVILNLQNLPVNTNPTGVINANYTRDHFVPYLKRQLAKTNAACIVIMDSATAHICFAVLAAFRLLSYQVD